MAISTDEALTKLFSDRKLTIETLLSIENKAREIVPFILNPIEDNMLSSATGRDIYVKPTQVGATSLWTGDFLIDNLTRNGTVSCIISYDEFSATRLLVKARKFYQQLHRRIPTIPRLDHQSSTELSFVNKATGFYSVFYIFSAGSYTIGRGEAIHNLLLDEYAFWPDGTHEEVFASAQQRVPLLTGTKIVAQSTPNGEDNPFCEFYRAALEGKMTKGSVYTPHFYTWFIHPEYVMYTDSPFCLPGDDVDVLPNLEPDEQNLYMILTDIYDFDSSTAMAKLRWRRYKKAEMKSLRRTGETVRAFDQEYPEDDISCFLSAGNMAYDVDLINEKSKACYPALDSKVFANEVTGIGAVADIWYDVEEGKSYLVSIDPGKGKQSESVAHVWHFEEGFTRELKNEGKEIVPPILQHCATLAGWYDEWEMAQYCMPLATYYNGAVIVPESNLDIVSHLKNYDSLYYRQDPRDGRVGRVIGWETNTSTKPYMLTELNKCMPDIECHDSRFWSQCKNIRRDPSRKYGISVVGMDDHHDAGAIAIVTRDSQAVERGLVGVSGWDDNWGEY